MITFGNRLNQSSTEISVVILLMERTIITIRENGRVNIPKGNVWMSEMELVVLFGVIAQVFQIVIRVIYKSETLTPMTTQQCTVITFTSWKIFYNHEIIIVLVF